MELFTKTNRSFSTNSFAPRYSFRLDASRRPAATQSLVVKLCGIWADLPPLTRRIPHAGRRQIRSIYFWAGRQFWVCHVCLVWDDVNETNSFFVWSDTGNLLQSEHDIVCGYSRWRDLWGIASTDVIMRQRNARNSLRKKEDLFFWSVASVFDLG